MNTSVLVFTVYSFITTNYLHNVLHTHNSTYIIPTCFGITSSESAGAKFKTTYSCYDDFYQPQLVLCFSHVLTDNGTFMPKRVKLMFVPLYKYGNVPNFMIC